MTFMDLDMSQTANTMSTKFNGTIMASSDKNRAVKDIKQPAPTNSSTRKTDPSQDAFDDEEE